MELARKHVKNAVLVDLFRGWDVRNPISARVFIKNVRFLAMSASFVKAFQVQIE